MTKISIIGLGLIGGSMALDLKSQLNVEVTGVDANKSNAAKVKALNLVDVLSTLDNALKQAEIVIIAIPVHKIELLLVNILDQINDRAIVIDVGSTKEQICQSVKDHPKRGRYVAAHPLAGTEFSGPEAAHRGLFSGKKNIICDKALSDEDAIQRTKELFDSLGMESYFMSSKEHDKHLAYVSHLSHLSSFTLSLTVLDIEENEHQIFNLASTGFESTSRLAKSHPDTWSAIFDKNNEHLLEALDRYRDYLDKFRKALIEKDKDTLHQLMQRANDIKRVLNKN